MIRISVLLAGDKGFEFLGYSFFPGIRLRSSSTSLKRLSERARQLYNPDQYLIYVLKQLPSGLESITLTPRQCSKLAVI